MSEPTRLKDDPSLAAILRSADDDVPPAASRRAIALALGLPAAATVTATATSASAAATVASTTAGTTTTAAATGASAIVTTGAGGTTGAVVATGAVGATVVAKTGVSLVGKVVLGLALATGAGIAVKQTVFAPEPAAPSQVRGAEAVAPATSSITPVTPSIAATPPSPAPTTPSVPAPRAQPTNAQNAQSSSVHAPSPNAPSPSVQGPPPATPKGELRTPANPAPEKVARIEPPASDEPAPTDAKRPLAQEVLLVDAALVALRKGDASAALRSLDDYEQRFPAGALAPEAAVARIEATFASGDAAKGKALADAFLAKHPDSPLAQRVRKLGQ